MASRLSRSTALALTTAAVFAAACTDQGPLTQGTGIQPSAVTASPGRQVITLKGAETTAFDNAVASLKGTIERRLPDINVVTITGLSKTSVTTLAKRPEVSRVDADVTLQWIPTRAEMVKGQQVLDPASAPPAPQGTDQSGAFFFGFQWNMRQVSAPAAWNNTPGGAGKLVCDLDTGIDPGHLDLNGKVDLTRSTSFVASEPFIEDLHFHGTFTAALISSNGIGMASVAPDARICAVKVLSQFGSGSFADVITGILYASEVGADAVNMSFGAYVDRESPGVKNLITLLQNAINVATKRGVVLVASAGNSAINLDQDPTNFLSIPAQLNNVITVGATAPINQQNFDLLTSYSNFGGVTGIDLVAPGGDLVGGGQIFDLVLSACSEFVCGGTNFYLLGAGTSFSAPHVTGAALVVESQLGGNQTPARLTGCLLHNNDNVGDFSIFGNGRLNVANAAVCSNP
jgi:subtilisin family serine protease